LLQKVLQDVCDLRPPTDVILYLKRKTNQSILNTTKLRMEKKYYCISNLK
jgi:hypothetical protein